MEDVENIGFQNHGYQKEYEKIITSALFWNKPNGGRIQSMGKKMV